jgi:large subunit ribosomal protein L22
MEYKVTSRYLRVSPRKVRPVIRQLVALDVERASALMKFTVRGSSPDILKALQSARANARRQNPESGPLFVKSITVDSGPTLKRWKAISRGRGSKILKRTSHLTVVLTDTKPSGGKA